MGELVIAADTSGSMTGVLPIVFGEVARICQSVKPSKVRVIWWDNKVQSEQVFTEGDYERIATLVKPQGGGGTTVSCVAQYISAKKYKPKAVIYLTDGYFESTYDVPRVPCLFGVVDHPAFVPLKGKVVRLDSLQM
jgi:predicted metal-dependent peptidase